MNRRMVIGEVAIGVFGLVMFLLSFVVDPDSWLARWRWFFLPFIVASVVGLMSAGKTPPPQKDGE